MAVGDSAKSDAAESEVRVRILVVEDERVLADSIAEWLRREALAVDIAYDGDAALERLGITDYDVLVLATFRWCTGTTSAGRSWSPVWTPGS